MIKKDETRDPAKSGGDTRNRLAKKRCICKGCPTYDKCEKGLAFCFMGKSKCIKDKKGCICGGCPVHLENKFKKYYYCINGAE